MNQQNTPMRNHFSERRQASFNDALGWAPLFLHDYPSREYIPFRRQCRNVDTSINNCLRPLAFISMAIAARVCLFAIVCVSALTATVAFPQYSRAAAQARSQPGQDPAEPFADLRYAVNTASKTHPAIISVQFEAQAAGAEVRAAEWQRFPSVSVESSVVDATFSGLGKQAVVRQPLWTGGRITSTIERASARDHAANHRIFEVVLSIAIDTTHAYFEYLRASQRINILRDSLMHHRRLVQMMERRCAQDINPHTDLDLVRTRTMLVEQELLQADAQAATSLNQLRELVGQPGFMPNTQPRRLTRWPVLDQNTIISNAIAYSPTMKRLAAEERTARAEASMAKAALLPEVSADYTYTTQGEHKAGLSIRFGFDGGLSKFELNSAARLREQSAGYQSKAAELELRRRIISDVTTYNSHYLKQRTGVQASDSARRVMDSYMRQFTSGRRSWLDVMNAVREAISTSIDASETVLGAQHAMARILLLTGRWAPVATEAKK